MDIENTVAEFRLEYEQLQQLIDKCSPAGKPPPLFITHYEYINSLATSILALSKKPEENVIALTSLLRMLLESIGVLYELTNGNTNHGDRPKFMKAYKTGNRGRDFPDYMSYRSLISRLPSVDKNASKTLKKLYDECSKATHFSKKSLDILNDVNDPLTSVRWSNNLIKLISDSYRQQSKKIKTSIET